MKYMELSDLLLNEAINQGLCQPWQENWKGDMDSLMSMYKRGIDFCIEHDYPSLDIIRRYLKGKTEDYNIYVDSDSEATVYADTVVVLGDSKMKIWIADYGVVSLYLLHNSEVSIFCGPHSKISVESYNDSVVKVRRTTNVSVYRYDNSIVEGDNVKIYNRERNAT